MLRPTPNPLSQEALGAGLEPSLSRGPLGIPRISSDCNLFSMRLEQLFYPEVRPFDRHRGLVLNL